MNQLLEKFLALRRMEYLVMNRDFIIQEASWKVHRFAECPHDVKQGKDARLAFPEFIGLEDFLFNILKEQAKNFELKGVERLFEEQSPLYFDISILKKDTENIENSDDHLIILFEEVTERVVFQQGLVQRANEASLLVNALASSQNYLDKIVASIGEALLVTTHSGIIKKVNQATLDLFRYSHEELLNQSISKIIADEAFSRHLAQRISSSKRQFLKDYEVVCHTKTGESLTVAFSCSAIQTDVENLYNFVYIGRDMTDRHQVTLGLQQSNEELISWVKELELRNREIALLNQMNDFLQACFTVEEACTALTALVPPLFPGVSGEIFLISTANTLVEVATTWGNPSLHGEPLFTCPECWALRRGQAHWTEGAENGWRCKHLHAVSTAESLCVPMMAQGEAMGVLYLSSSQPGALTQSKQRLAVTVAENIALLLANLKLREALQQQSIRDPLTGLFNRRYMEDSLVREISRAEVMQHSLGIIMLDVDHFKRFNDTFGHEAGDTILRELGQFLKQQIRSSDLACRYGGEELTLILPDISLEAAHERAETIRHSVKHLRLQNRHQSLGSITLSLGVAVFPKHGLTGESVMQSADAALYQAKAQGRDRVVIASNVSAWEKTKGEKENV